jgi:hypothetical protein
MCIPNPTIIALSLVAEVPNINPIAIGIVSGGIPANIAVIIRKGTITKPATNPPIAPNPILLPMNMLE